MSVLGNRGCDSWLNGLMAMSVDELLAPPLLVRTGQPLRVALYARLAEGIRTGVFPLGSMLPRETELGVSVGASRTVVREALMLLEEDGLVITRRGVGRFVADRLPETGLEELRPLEEVLATKRTTVTVRVGELVLQAATPYTAGHLAIDEAANTWFCESVVESDGRPVAIVQEHLPAGRYLSDASRLVASNLEQAHADPGTILAALIARCGPIFSSGVCEVTANVVGASRGKLLGLGATAPVLILTQTVLVGAHPAYLAKCIVSAEVGRLKIFQSGSPA